MKTELLQFFTTDSAGSKTFTVIGKKDGKLEVSVAADAPMQSLTVDVPADLKDVSVGDVVYVTEKGGKLEFKSTTFASSGKQGKTTGCDGVRTAI